MPSLFRAILPVADMKRADVFWGRLLDLEVDPVVPTRHYLHGDGTILALVDPSEHGRAHRRSPELIYFRVPDLEAAHARAREAGSRSLEGEADGIRDQVWGERSFYGADPFGNPYCMVDAKSHAGSRIESVYGSGGALPQLFKVVLPVDDLASAGAFWGELLGLLVDTDVDNRHFLYCGQCMLALVDPIEHDRAHGRPTRRFSPNPEVVYLAVPDLEATYQKSLALGGRPLEGDDVGEGIVQRVWGERSFYAKDPAGNPFCIVDDQTLFTGST